VKLRKFGLSAPNPGEINLTGANTERSEVKRIAGLSVPMDPEPCFSKKISMIFLLFVEPLNMKSDKRAIICVVFGKQLQ
jgi:hypothetical protein